MDDLKNDDKTIYTTDSEFGPGKKAGFIKKQIREKAEESGSHDLQSPETGQWSSSTSDSSWAENELKAVVNRNKFRT